MLLFSAFLLCAFSYAQDVKRVILYGGKSVHPYGAHENGLAPLLVKSSLEEALKGRVKVDVISELPQDVKFYEGAALIVFFSEGMEVHPLLNREAVLKTIYDAKVSVAMFHYALVFTGYDNYCLLENAVGGYFEKFYSVNPSWDAKIHIASEHPAVRGLADFDIFDEWYFNIRLRPHGVTALIKAVPPESVLKRPDGMHTNNKYARATLGQPHVLAWVCENENGTRGFGFTGWHYIWNYNNDKFRKLIVNSIAWAAGFEVPQGGFDTSRPSIEYMDSQITKPKPQGWDATLADWKAKAALWNN